MEVGGMETSALEKIEEIVRLLKEKDYDPIEQLTGYVTIQQDYYITRHGDTRDKIQEIDIADIQEYLKQFENSKN